MWNERFSNMVMPLKRFFFGDGLTRRSAKRSQAVQPPLERRGAPRDLASRTEN